MKILCSDSFNWDFNEVRIVAEGITWEREGWAMVDALNSLPAKHNPFYTLVSDDLKLVRKLAGTEHETGQTQ